MIAKRLADVEGNEKQITSICISMRGKTAFVEKLSLPNCENFKIYGKLFLTELRLPKVLNFKYHCNYLRKLHLESVLSFELNKNRTLEEVVLDVAEYVSLKDNYVAKLIAPQCKKFKMDKCPNLRYLHAPETSGNINFINPFDYANVGHVEIVALQNLLFGSEIHTKSCKKMYCDKIFKTSFESNATKNFSGWLPLARRIVFPECEQIVITGCSEHLEFLEAPKCKCLTLGGSPSENARFILPSCEKIFLKKMKRESLHLNFKHVELSECKITSFTIGKKVSEIGIFHSEVKNFSSSKYLQEFKIITSKIEKLLVRCHFLEAQVLTSDDCKIYCDSCDFYDSNIRLLDFPVCNKFSIRRSIVNCLTAFNTKRFDVEVYLPLITFFLLEDKCSHKFKSAYQRRNNLMIKYYFFWKQIALC